MNPVNELFTDSIRYWESRRILYNAALAAVLAAVVACHWPRSMAGLDWQSVAGLLLAAVMANVLYCSAYAVDLVFQLSEYRSAWKRRRWMLLAAGTMFAAGLFLLHAFAGDCR